MCHFLILMREDLLDRSSLRGPAMCVWGGGVLADVRVRANTSPTQSDLRVCPSSPEFITQMSTVFVGARTLPPPSTLHVCLIICGCVLVYVRACGHTLSATAEQHGGAHDGPQDRGNVGID